MPRLEGFLSALLLAVIYLIQGRGHLKESRHWRDLMSAAAGASIAYIFVGLLPELNERQKLFLASLAGRESLFAQYRVYLSALVGFVAFYGLSAMVLAGRAQRRKDDRMQADPSYWLHIGGFAGYSALISYLIIDQAKSGVRPWAIYSLAMALHIAVAGHALREEYRELYDRHGKWLLAAGVMIGWVIGSLWTLSPTMMVRLFGFIAGGVVINSISDEMPKRGEGRFLPFCAGAAVYTLLLVLS